MLTIRETGLEDYLDPEGGNAWVQALIIGDHGVGKTPFAAKWPRPIFAMCEHGTMSIAKDKVPVGEIHTDADMDAFITLIRQDCAIKDMSRRKYMTVVVDTVDAYQKRLMDLRVRTQQLDRFTGWDNWDWLDAKVSKMLRELSNLPIHLVVNMHFKKIMVGEGDDKVMDREAKLKGDMKTTVYQEFDLIGFMETYYMSEGGARVRKHRIRWWPEPGFEMVRARAVGADGVLLPQFTPVDFAPSDFQVIFDAIASGVEGLEESKVVAELPTGDDTSAEGLPAPDEGAGPVASPALPPANRPAAEAKTPRATIAKIKKYIGDDVERAKAALEAELAHEEGPRPSFVTWLEKMISEAPAADTPTDNGADNGADTPVDEPGAGLDVPAGQEAPAEGTSEGASEDDEAAAVAQIQESIGQPDPAPSSQNGKGTAEVPLVMEEDRLNKLDGPKYAVLEHVHSPEGKCLKSNFVKPCPLATVTTSAQAEAAAAAQDETDTELPVEEPPTEGGPPPAEPTPAPEAAPAPAGAAVCGDQPETLKAHPAKPGCGKVLTPDNKAPLAVVKHKTLLCTDCFAAA